MSLRDAWPPSTPVHPHKAALGPVLEKPVLGQFLATIIFHSFWNFPTWFSVSSRSPLGDLEEGRLGGRKSHLEWPQCTSAVPRALWVLLHLRLAPLLKRVGTALSISPTGKLRLREAKELAPDDPAN